MFCKLSTSMSSMTLMIALAYPSKVYFPECTEGWNLCIHSRGHKNTNRGAWGGLIDWLWRGKVIHVSKTLSSNWAMAGWLFTTGHPSGAMGVTWASLKIMLHFFHLHTVTQLTPIWPISTSHYREGLQVVGMTSSRSYALNNWLASCVVWSMRHKVHVWNCE